MTSTVLALSVNGSTLVKRATFAFSPAVGGVVRLRTREGRDSLFDVADVNPTTKRGRKVTLVRLNPHNAKTSRETYVSEGWAVIENAA